MRLLPPLFIIGLLCISPASAGSIPEFLQSAREKSAGRKPLPGKSLKRRIVRFREEVPAAERASAAVEKLNVRWKLAARALDSVSPLATLDRGYAIVSDDESGAVLTNADEVKKGAGIRAQLGTGMLKATVTESIRKEPDAD